MSERILMVTMGLDIGGAETHIVELSKQLKTMGHDVAVVSNGGVYVEEIVAAGIRHYAAPLNRRSLPCMLRSLLALHPLDRLALRRLRGHLRCRNLLRAELCKLIHRCRCLHRHHRCLLPLCGHLRIIVGISVHVLILLCPV